MKRGSALLIVLGMVAFMTISAIAFAAFMRMSRQPSSYLRRTSSSRLLVKAALAEAIDEIDVAIGNDLYPGMGRRGRQYYSPRAASTSSSSGRGIERKRNYWRKGCFIASNEFEKVENTVSTLTLEGLAYLPPFMINEARYYSRHTSTASWKTLPFEAGRYAFSAFDVSGCFDINRVSANVGRNSSDNGRISLACLFENVKHDGYASACKPTDWAQFMDSFVDAANAADDENAGRMPEVDNKVPLVSLADYSLAAKKDLTSYPNPFCDYVKNGVDFVVETGEEEAWPLRSQMFVTASYLPKSPVEESVTEAYDLNDEANQPFPLADLTTQEDVPIRTATDASSKAASRLRDKGWLCGVGLAALWDYLDADSVPISLAVPTVERTPMICGLEVKVGSGDDVKLKFAVTTEAPGGGVADVFLDAGESNPSSHATVLRYNVGKSEEDATDRVVSQRTLYKLDPKMFGAFFGGLDVNVLTVYPFRRVKNTARYTIGGCLAFYFSEKTEKSFHTETDTDILHLGCDAQKYAREQKMPTFNTQLGVFYVPLEEKDLSVPTSIDKEENAVAGCQLLPAGSENVDTVFATKMDESPMFTVTRSWRQTREYNSQTGTYTSWTPKDPPTDGDDKATIVEAVCNVPPLAKDYSPDANYTKSQSFLQMVESGQNAMDVIPQLSVWVYVKDKDGKYVDLVPACVKDDDDLNQVNNYEIWGPDANFFGVPYPLMNFYGTEFAYNPAEMSKSDSDFMKGADFGIESSVLFSPDPRWNWAPEQWIKVSGATLDAATWLANSQCDRSGVNGRDRDIFMETSDAGYLQSVYELAFLPRLTDWPEAGEDGNPTSSDPTCCGNMTPLDSVGHSDFATHVEKTGNDDRSYVVNSEFMWRTYRPFAYYQQKDGEDGKTLVASADDFDSVGFTSVGTGFRVNPYATADSLVVAFANSPCSWYIASTNKQSGAKLETDKRKVETDSSRDFNANYAFSEHQVSADPAAPSFAWSDLEQIAQKIYRGVHEIVSSDEKISDDEKAVEWIGKWKGAFDSLDWAGVPFSSDSPTFADVTLGDATCDLTDADKKFLYGYWRECFAPRQQLFLVFVRAEPVLMGGGSASSAPPQLGARAVALVWRDPMPTIEDVGDDAQPRPHRTRVLFYRQFE